MIEPSGIPQFVGNLDQLEKDVSALRSDAIGVRNGGKDVHSRFQALAGVYKAPEDTQLFDTTRPVMDKAEAFATKLETVADALDTFSIEARPLAKQLAHLKADALAFVDSVAGDDDWTYDEDKIDRHQKLIDGVSAAESAFRDAERRAAGKISALVGGPRFVVDDGSHTVNDKSVMYGYGLEALKHAKELPWGTPESESHHAWEVGYWAKSYVWDGLVVDNIWGGIKGLGTLVGIGPEDTSDAWGHIWDMVGGIGQYTAKPYDWVMDHTIGPDEESADEVRQKHAAKDFGKGLVAWDMWGENPARASATVTFNLLTLGAGPAAVAAKGGEAGALAKAAGTASKVGTYLDPLSAGLTVGGKAISALPKLSEVTAGIRNVFDTTASSQRLHSVIELPDGSKVLIKDGKFIPVGADGKVNTAAPHAEKPADMATTPETNPTRREPAVVGAHAHGATPQTHGPLPPPAAHESGAVRPRSGGTAGQSEHGGRGWTTDSPAGTSGRGGSGGGHGSAHDGTGGEREFTAAERKRIQDEHIRKANEDPAWLKEHYDTLGRRKPNVGLVEGVELPQLVKDPQGRWIAKHNMPSGPSEVRFGAKPLARGTAPDDVLPTLDRSAANRQVYRDLMNAQKAFESTPSAPHQEALTAAQDAYAKQLGDVPPNSKISEELGERASRLHAIPHEFPGATVIELPKTPNGANMFDGAYRIEDDGILIVEDKAPGNDLDWRQGRADPEDPVHPHLGDDGGAAGMRVKQGTLLYLRTIMAEMTKRGGRDAVLAREFRNALKAGKLKYVLVKAKEPDGSLYAGAVVEHMHIY
ncbi:hypothetical protein [Streptomyces sp. NBC_01750]|uniref:hypothetical protein n=1 Tax=Streptomyces sp. NBC_01750 TaxID=2975928 RepID=UPI002DDBFEAF|nr:hypothetical protein [Streptomyces sp. NBC_01750]WSD36397.1 hypothetical protein OG966_33530 [Streptomyces sp. NBC_01750]